MATFEVKVISKDMIKPSTQTPPNLKTLPFSFLDQIAPSVHVPNILFYQTPPLSPLTLSSRLKTTLSETLVRFYPLAGRIQGDVSIDCNDEGVEFYETRVSSSLSSIIQDPNLDELLKLLPFTPVNHDKQQMLAGVQVNHFSCGGVAIGFSASHKIADAKTVIAFLNDWAIKTRAIIHDNAGVAVQLIDCCRGEFISASIFPQDLGKDDPVRQLPSTMAPTEKVVTKRVLFNKERINALRKKAILGGYATEKATPPSRTIVVCAFIWKQFIEAARAKPHPPKLYGARQLVGLRTIPNSSVPDNCLGNMYGVAATASYNMENYNVEFDDDQLFVQLITKLEKSIKQIDLQYLEKLRNGEALMGLPREFSENIDPQDVEICGFSSCVTIPFYEVDFGWGNPVWYSLTSLPHKNMVLLCPTKCGEGIEAWVNLPQDLADLFEQDSIAPKLASKKAPSSRM